MRALLAHRLLRKDKMRGYDRWTLPITAVSPAKVPMVKKNWNGGRTCS